MSELEPLSPLIDRAGVRRAADLRLRGADGTIAVRVRWPASGSAAVPPPVMVFLPDVAAAGGVDETDDALCRELCSRAQIVVLCVPWAAEHVGAPCSALERAAFALEWSADHADELGADPGRLVIAGHGVGAAAAAALSLRARDRGWPSIARQLLILTGSRSVRRPEHIDASAHRGAPVRRTRAPRALAAATIVVPDRDRLTERRARCSERLRALGAEVEELHAAGASGATALAEPLLLELAGSLRRALADSAERAKDDQSEDAAWRS
jgi:alpha/beta hydrolase fold